jgi:hypothetical protein
MKRLCLVLTCLLLGPVAAHAEAPCQWFSEGSASTLLGGPAVALSARFLPSGEGACSFSLRQERTSYLIEIAIGPSVTNACPSGSPLLRGIGNEALACRLAPSATRQISKVSSRVRSTYFTASLTVDGPSGLTASKQEEIAHVVAEQVAGNLY